MPAGQAVQEATSFLAVPLLGSTLTTVFSFGPIALMPGPSGEFVGSIAIVTIVAVLSSLVISLTIVTRDCWSRHHRKTHALGYSPTALRFRR